MDNDILDKGIELLNSGSTIKEIVEKLNISVDKAKKISQIANMNKIISTLELNLKNKFKKLGFKALVLNPIFKENDIDGIKEILESIDINIKRDELKLLPIALKEKRKRLIRAKENAENEINHLKQTEDEINSKIEEMKENKKEIEKSMGFLNDIEDKNTKKFLMEHLGVSKGKIVLYKRLDISWQQYLKQRKAIIYNKSTFTWEVANMEELKRQTQNRFKNKKDMYYDYTKATGLFQDFAPKEAEYKNAIGIGSSLLEQEKQIEKDLKELKKQKRNINKNLKELKGTKIQSYMDSVEISNYISEYEIINHRKLQDIGMKYLYNDNQVVATEITVNNYRFDVIGYNKDKEITIIEAKASIEDFRNDNKFYKYLLYCDRMYFIFEKYIYEHYLLEINQKIKNYNIGILVATENRAVIIKESSIHNINQQIKDNIIYTINRILSRKFIYGR